LRGATEVVVGDLGDPQSLDRALEGVEGVFYIGPLFAENESQLGLNMLAAARRAGVRRFVFSSIIHPTLDFEGHSAKIPVEAALYASGLDFVILHPATFFQNIQAAWPVIVDQGIIAEPYSKKARLARVDYRDVAEIAAIALTEDRLNYGTFELCADGLMSREEIAQLFSEVLGRKITAAEPSWDEWIARARLPFDERQKSLLKQMFDLYGQYGSYGNSLVLRSLLGREPRTLRDFFAELLAKSQKTA
jgi:uncharacterized protein YbjT (DUF2867 family)